MRPRDQNILAREVSQQLMPRRRRRSLVDVEKGGDLGMLQLDAQCMDDVAQNRICCPFDENAKPVCPGV